MAILANEKVLTLDYWKPAYKLQPGDYVFNKDGKPVKVKLIQEYKTDTCYQVYFDDHLTVAGDKHLQFFVEDATYRELECKYKGIRRFERQLKRIPVENMAGKSLKNHKNRSLYSVPTTNPLDFPHQFLPVDPFLFGFWFLNRRSTKDMAAPPGYSPFIHQRFKDCGYKVQIHRLINTGERTFTVYPTIESQLKPNLPDKIPSNYLLASAEQRIELLRGILHSKSRHYSKTKDRFRIPSCDYSFIMQMQQLVESLGHRTNIEMDPRVNHYTLFFRSKLQLMDTQKSKKLKVHHARRYIKEIEPILGQSCVHIETESNDKSFLVGQGFIACR